MILTPLPFLNMDLMVLKVASTAEAAAIFVRSALLATAAINSCLFIGPFLSFASIEAAAEEPLRAENLPIRPDSQPILAAAVGAAGPIGWAKHAPAKAGACFATLPAHENGGALGAAVMLSWIAAQWAVRPGSSSTAASTGVSTGLALVSS